MENIKKKYFIGATEDYSKIITADIEIRDWNGYPEFTTSYNVGELINIDEMEETAHDYYEESFNYSYNAEQKLDLLKNGELTREEVIQNWIADEYDYRDRIDCSCTDYEFTLDNCTFNYATSSCGQVDIFEEIEEKDVIDENVLKLYNFWENHHCKEITEDNYNELMKILDGLKKYDLDELDLAEYIKENIKEVA